MALGTKTTPPTAGPKVVTPAATVVVFEVPTIDPPCETNLDFLSPDAYER